MPFDPLYSENVGLGGFRCRECGRVTRTYSGMKSHLRIVHGIKIQGEFPFERRAESDGAIPNTSTETCRHGDDPAKCISCEMLAKRGTDS